MMMHRGLIDVSFMYLESFLGGIANQKELRVLSNAWGWVRSKFVDPVVGGLGGRVKSSLPIATEKMKTGTAVVRSRIASNASRAVEIGKRIASALSKRI